jgi:hypothetical protein
VGAVAPVITWALAKKYPKSWLQFVSIPVALNGALHIPPATGINVRPSLLERRTDFDGGKTVLFVVPHGLHLPCVSLGLALKSGMLTALPYRVEYYIRRRYFSYWSKFAYVLSAGLDAGTIMSALFIFFTLSLPKGGTICEWRLFFDPFSCCLLPRRSLRRAADFDPWEQSSTGTLDDRLARKHTLTLGLLLPRYRWGNNVFTNTLDWQEVSYKTVPPEGFF